MALQHHLRWRSVAMGQRRVAAALQHLVGIALQHRDVAVSCFAAEGRCNEAAWYGHIITSMQHRVGTVAASHLRSFTRSRWRSIAFGQQRIVASVVLPQHCSITLVRRSMVGSHWCNVAATCWCNVTAVRHCGAVLAQRHAGTALPRLGPAGAVAWRGIAALH